VQLVIQPFRIYNHTMNQSFHLFQLQKIDSRLDILDNRLSEINKILASDETIKQAETRVNEIQALLDQAKINLRKIEEEVKNQQIKIETNSASLYGGKIHNPKELQDLQNDIVSLQKYLATLEDQELMSMMVIEQIEHDIILATDNYEQVQAKFANQKASLLGEQSQVTRDKEKLILEREASLVSIRPENLEKYNQLRKIKRGFAVASISEGACTACGATLPPAEWQAARSPYQIVYCSSCGRILYAG
jgi:uncharacterized protein